MSETRVLVAKYRGQHYAVYTMKGVRELGGVPPEWHWDGTFFRAHRAPSHASAGVQFIGVAPALAAECFCVTEKRLLYLWQIGRIAAAAELKRDLTAFTQVFVPLHLLMTEEC